MKITCISDLRGYLPELPGGDLLIIAGDLTARHTFGEFAFDFLTWLDQQNYNKKVVIGGNHDTFMIDDTKKLFNGIADYLEDSGTEFESLKIWGSPWTRWFHGINPRCEAFTRHKEESLGKKWALIPDDVDILVTHGPPFTIRDLTERGEQVGSTSLMDEHVSRIRPRLWVFGHIHEGYGIQKPYEWSKCFYVNCSLVDENYQPVNKPIEAEL
jgi:Icc-related predicted phosphoesterase